MKVLQLVTSRQFRGAEVFAAMLSQELERKGITVLFVGLYPPPPESLTVVGSTNLDLNGKKRFISFGVLYRLVQLIRREDPDVIQANGSDTLKYAVAARYFLRSAKPIVYRNISMVSAWVGGSFLKRKFYGFLFSKVDFVTSVGQESINDLIGLFGYPAKRTRVIRRGIPIEPVDRGNARNLVLEWFNLSKDTRLIVHAGSFTKEKNHEFLLDVFALVKESEPDLKLILVGTGERVEFIKDRIKNRGLENTVFMAGFRTDVGIFLSAADLVVLCSRVEGVPGVILEAAAQKTPALAIDVGGVREVIDNKVTGIVHQGYDPVAFSGQLLNMLGDAGRLRLMGESAYEYVKTNFNPSVNAELFIDLYQRLMRGDA